MKRVVMSMDAPGSRGEVEVTCSDAEVEFLERLKEAWNTNNQLHAQPIMELEVYDKGEKK